MRQYQQVCGVHQEPEPEIIVISSDLEEVVDLEPEEPEREEVDIPSVLEDGEVKEMVCVPTVANRVRIGQWRDGFWYNPGDPSNYSRHDGYRVWELNKPPMDGVEGGLSFVGKQDLKKNTLGRLLYNQWLRNKDKDVVDHVTLGKSIYNAWLESKNTE